MIRHIICLILLVLGTTEAFLLQIVPAVFRNRHCRHQCPHIITSLWAAKKKKKTTKNTKRSSSAATGFSPSSSSSSSSSKKAVRSHSHSSSSHGYSHQKALSKAANLFDKLYKQHGVEACLRDVYVRSPRNSKTTFWFVGKIIAAVAAQDDNNNNNISSKNATTTTSSTSKLLPLDHEAAVAQKRLILEHAKRLRPQNMLLLAGGASSGSGGHGDLELWLAPGNSEMDVVQNKITLERVVGTAQDLSHHDLNQAKLLFGFNPEIYVGEHEITKGGLRVERDEQGRPVKPVFEINQ